MIGKPLSLLAHLPTMVASRFHDFDIPNSRLLCGIRVAHRSRYSRATASIQSSLPVALHGDFPKAGYLFGVPFLRTILFGGIQSRGTPTLGDKQ